MCESKNSEPVPYYSAVTLITNNHRVETAVSVFFKLDLKAQQHNKVRRTMTQPFILKF